MRYSECFYVFILSIRAEWSSRYQILLNLVKNQHSNEETSHKHNQKTNNRAKIFIFLLQYYW